MCKNVQILMAVYNGEPFLEQQLESIFRQSYRDFTIIISDDQSTDGTTSIINRWSERFPGHIVLMDRPERHLGPLINYARLIDEADGDYIFFCDQDDVWFDDKIEKCMERILEEEKLAGDDTPLLLHTDLSLVDENLNIFAPSWNDYAGIDSTKSLSLPKLLVRYAIPGCSMLANKALINIASPIPSECYMYDYWLSLVAAASGKIISLPQACMYYRRHAHAVTQVHNFDWSWFLESIKDKQRMFEREETRILRSIVLAVLLYKRYAQVLDRETKAVLEAYINLKYQPFYKELINRVRYGFLDRTLWQDLTLLYGSYQMGKIPVEQKLF